MTTDNTNPKAPRPPLSETLSAAVAVGTTAASIAFTTWAVADLATGAAEGAAPVAIAVGAGLAVEGVWLFLLATEWGQAVRTGRPSKALSVAGWVLAVVASAVIVVHGLVTDPVMAILAVLPVGAKAAWFFRTRDRAAQTLDRLAEEEATAARTRKLSTAPTDEEEEALAARERQLEVRRRQRELDRREADADSADRIAEIERQGREELAETRAHFTVAREIQRNDREIGYRQGAGAARIALGSGAYAPDDASELDDTGRGFGAGFGSAMAAQARTAQTPTLRTSPEEQVPTPVHLPPRGGAQVSAAEAAARRELVWATRDQLLEETGEEPTYSALARKLSLSRQTIKRHLEADD